MQNPPKKLLAQYGEHKLIKQSYIIFSTINILYLMINL